jgi:hypothetical protein
VPHLRRIMLEELQRRNYSDATTRYYIRKVEAFALQRHLHATASPLDSLVLQSRPRPED